MGRNHHKIPTVPARLAPGHGRILRSATRQSPAPKTSFSTNSRASSLDRMLTHSTSLFTVFDLPDELILSILSYIFPDPPRHIGDYARFRINYPRNSDYNRRRWIDFLRTLSMTCKAMRLRLLPWVWGRIEVLKILPDVVEISYKTVRHPLECFARGHVYGHQREVPLYPSLRLGRSRFVSSEGSWRCMSWTGTSPPLPFVRCLESLPNLHTLEIGWIDDFTTTGLEDALNGVELPQIKALLIPRPAYPLLQHCRDVEEVVCIYVTEDKHPSSDVFLESLASNPNSKVKQLAIPLGPRPNPSRK